MATSIADLKTKVKNANALGVANLIEKGVAVDENATTYEIMQSIADVLGGGGTEELENLIDQSGVLDSTEGSVTEKVEQLIDKAKSGSSPTIDENGIVTFGGNTTIDDNGIVSL